MLAQLPRHTIAKKVDNYEHLDILWGKDVDKVVFPHVLDLLKAYAEPVDSQEAQSPRDIPSYSINHIAGPRKRSLGRESEVPYTQAVNGDLLHHAQRLMGLSNASVEVESGESYEIDENDSDETTGEDPSTSFQISVTHEDGVDMKL